MPSDRDQISWACHLCQSCKVNLWKAHNQQFESYPMQSMKLLAHDCVSFTFQFWSIEVEIWCKTRSCEPMQTFWTSRIGQQPLHSLLQSCRGIQASICVNGHLCQSGCQGSLKIQFNEPNASSILESIKSYLSFLIPLKRKAKFPLFDCPTSDLRLAGVDFG